MIFKNKIAMLFFVLSLVFALISMPFSAAISQGKMDRSTSAKIADDENGALKLIGFNDSSYVFGNSYTNFGSITNNTNQTLMITVNIIPNFSLFNSLSRLGIKIGSDETVFSVTNTSPKQVTLSLASGQVINVQGYLTDFLGLLPVEFQFSAKNATDTYTIQLNNTANTTRRIAVTSNDSSTGKIKVQMYNGNRTVNNNTISPRMKVYNTGTKAINLSDVKMRYYFTIDGEKLQNFWCDWSSAGENNITGTLVKLSSTKTGADYYLEVGFKSSAGTLAAGKSVEIHTRFAKTDWTNYSQSNDYSFNNTGKAYADWTKMTGYLTGNLVWGVEP